MRILAYEFSSLLKSFAPAPRASSVTGRALPIVATIACALAVPSGPLKAQDAQLFPRERIQAGSKIYVQRCVICHGQNMRSPDQEIGAFDLRYFPRDGHDRFVTSVSRGKNTMPAWGDSLTAADIEALWAYVCGGEN